MATDSSRRTLALLLAGAAVGVAAAAGGLMSGPGAGARLPKGAVARVNGTLIRGEEYERLVAAATQDRREPLDAAERRHVLDRLIEEELLVQRGLELGLAASDRKVRSDLTASMISSVTEEQDQAQPSEAQLRAFLQDNLDFFAGPGRLRVRQVFVRVPTGDDEAAGLERAREAERRLRAGDVFAAVQAALGDAELPALPDALLPAAKLRDYLGPTALRSALDLDAGAISEPVRSSSGYHVLQVAERQPDQAPPFEEIREQVLVEYRRRAGENALRRYLDDLRRRADVAVAQDLP